MPQSLKNREFNGVEKEFLKAWRAESSNLRIFIR